MRNTSEKYKCDWIAPERTGSRKVSEILSFYGFKHNNRPIYEYGKYNYAHEVMLNSIPKEYKIICSARNPYSKVLSLFKNFYENSTDKSKDSFKKYVINDLPKGQMIKMVINPVLNKVPDYILRLENLTEDLLKLPFIHDVLTTKQVELLSSHGKQLESWEEYYDDEMKEIVYLYTKQHFDMFGYKK